MGCDGGTIPKRDELVKKKQKPEEKDKQAEAIAKWRYCALSCQILRKPIVSCKLGRLYNKEAIIQYLLDKETSNEVAEHIRGLKDIKELNLTLKPGYEEKAIEGGVFSDSFDSPYICPVTSLEMNGKYKFCYNWTCGCVVSERALKEVKSETCHKCGQPYNESDTIILNGSEEDFKMQRKRLEENRIKEKNEKNEKRGKKRKNVPHTSDDDGQVSSAISSVSMESGKVAKKSEEVNPKYTKISVTNILPQKASSSYSVAKDTSASEAYKSLFTTHETAKNKPKAHWITFNPLYN